MILKINSLITWGLIMAVLSAGVFFAGTGTSFANSAAYCDDYARNYADNYANPGGDALGSALGGAATGALLGGIFGGGRGAGTGAAIGGGHRCCSVVALRQLMIGLISTIGPMTGACLATDKCWRHSQI